MIEFLRGKLAGRHPARLLIDVGGVGYGVNVSLRTSEAAGPEGGDIALITHLNVREDALELYGFVDELEKSVFLMLIRVSGIGPRMALRILSATPPEILGHMISQGDVKGLTSLKGVGRKTAELMVASLKAGMAKLSLDARARSASLPPAGQTQRDAVLGLVTLGVKEAQAEPAVRKAAQKLGDKVTAAQLIAQALQEI